MADSSARAAQGARRTRPSTGPDWETLPDIALLNILQRVASTRSCAHFFVCKRRWSFAKEAQHSHVLGGKEPEGNLQYRRRRSLVLGLFSRLPNLTSVHLTGFTFTDIAPEALAAHCPKLLDLRLETPRTALVHSSWGDPARVARGLGALTGLHSLFLHLPGVRLPASVSSLQQLESLSVENAGPPLPDALGAISSLTSLCLKGLNYSQVVSRRVPPVTGLLASIWQLTGLEELTLHRLPTGRTPPQLGNLTSLRRLDLDGLDFTSLDDTLTCLCNLEELKLNCRILRDLPADLHKLKNLRIFHLDAWALRSLPQCLLEASETGETLALEELSLTSLWTELTGGLACLSSTLRRMELSLFDQDLPDELGSLSHLENLTLRECTAVGHLPESLGDLSSLQRLRIQGCFWLEDLPGALTRCLKMEVLSVADCRRLKSFPEDLGNIRALRVLSLMRLPSLTHLPQSLANANGLQQLTLQGCPHALPFPALLNLPRLDQEPRRNLQLLPPWISRSCRSAKQAT